MAIPKVEPAVTATDLTLFQQEMLIALARAGPLKGTAIKQHLEDRYGEKLHHGRIYQNTEPLVEMGLLDKCERDGRTNEYSLTDEAKDLLRRDAQRRYNAADSLGGRFGGEN